ncbi:MAG: CehA/McbA family metallohydrolase domain-containing protein [Planctomycetota bacterium]|jgi:hypothetical protein
MLSSRFTGSRRRVPGARSVVAAIVVLSCVAARAGTLELRVVDEQGASLPCRVLVRTPSGTCVVPEGAVVLEIGRDRWFMSPGRSEIEVPEGDVELRVERGLEYVRSKESIEVAGPTTSKTVTLRRWVDMKHRGYLCAENHLHVDAGRLAPMLAAEGLDFGTTLTWWNGPDQRRPVPSGSGRIRTLQFAGAEIPTSVFDAELEYGWGAAYIQNLPGPMPIESDRGRPNLDYLKHAVSAGALVHYQGGWSREVGLDALLGRVHTVNVCNNNFHLHRFQPRSRYSNLLEVEGFPVYPDTDRGMVQMNTDTYYRLLNWGLRLAAGAGSATGVKQVPVGYNRAYVRTEAGASLEAFNKDWAAGKNFVTNGPVLLLKSTDGRRPGDTIELPEGGGTVRLEATALSDPHQLLTSVEIVVNGRVAESIEVTDRHRLVGEVEIDVRRPCWVAARATVRDNLLTDDELAAYAPADPGHPFRQMPSRLRFAHTSPIHVTVGGQSTAVPKSIEEGLRMLDRFEAFARENAGGEHQAPVLAAVDEARGILQARLRDGR